LLWNDLAYYKVLSAFQETSKLCFLLKSPKEIPPNQVSTNEFGSWVNCNNLMAHPFLVPFIFGIMVDWVHIEWIKLDRIFANFDYLDLYKAYNYSILPRSNSDHHPLLLGMFDDVVIARPSSFIFFFK